MKFDDRKPNRFEVIDFKSKDNGDLDFWPSDLKNNRGHLVVMTKHHSKFEDSRPFWGSYWSKEIFQQKVTVTLTFDLVT